MGSQHNELRKPEMIYILGPSYSGSTILTFLLSKHPTIATIGELKASKMGDIGRYLCSCNEPILECKFWQMVTKHCAQKNLDFTVRNFDTALRANSSLANRIANATVRGEVFEKLRRAVLSALPGARKAFTHSVHRNFLISQVICELEGKAVFLDGSKTPSRLLHFVNSGFWNVKVISIVRDGRGVSNSNKKHLDISMRSSVQRWVHVSKEIRRVLRLLPNVNCIAIKYEDLCKDTTGTLLAITKFLGLSPFHIGDGITIDGDNHILGNSMRLKSTSEIRLDESWRKELSASDLSEFSHIAGRLNKQFGYT